MNMIKVQMKIILGIIVLIPGVYLTFSTSDIIAAKLFNAISIIVCLTLFRLLSKANQGAQRQQRRM
ncbi:MAG: hypothetical protein JST75_08985 [Bacteroidetes bacterium]|nr:hypothetical protein [Bacteroidota bacterium]